MPCYNFADPKLTTLKVDCQSLQQNALAPSTIRARKGQWSTYVKFCKEFNLKTLPCSNRQLSWYITYLERYMVYSSIINYAQAVLLAHRLRNIEPPSVSSHSVKLTLLGVKRRSGSNPNPRAPMTISILRRLYSCLNFNVKFHVLFWAASLLLFRSLLRVSHVVESPHSLRVNDIMWSEEGYNIKVRSSKTSRQARLIPVNSIITKSLCSVFWLKHWVKLSKLPGNAPLFSITGVRAMSYNQFSNFLSRVLAAAHVDVKISSHSFRQGGASFLSSIGIPLHKIKERGGWKSNAVYLYITENLKDKVLRERLVAAAVDLHVS